MLRTILIIPVVVVVLVAKVSSVLLISTLPVLLLVVSTTSHSLHILFDEIDDFIGNTEVFDRAAADVAFVHLPELVAVLRENYKIEWCVMDSFAND